MTDLRTTATLPSDQSDTPIPGPSSGRVRQSHDWRRIAVNSLFVLVVFVAGGIVLSPQGALLVIGPISLFAMPIVASLADFVVPLLVGHERRWLVAGLLLSTIVLGAIVLAVLAQAVVGHIDLIGVFSPNPSTAASHLTTFPFTIPLGGVLFVLYLEVAIVSGVPALTRHRRRDGALVFLGCAVMALIVYLTLANWGAVPAPAQAALGLRDPGGPIDALDLAGIVISISIWQVLYLFFGGGAYRRDSHRLGARIVVANVVVIGLGISTYWLLRFPCRPPFPRSPPSPPWWLSACW